MRSSFCDNNSSKNLNSNKYINYDDFKTSSPSLCLKKQSNSNSNSNIK